MVIVILSGGSGTRLWPASRKHKPKQFLKLFGQDSLLVQTARRALRAGNPRLLVVTHADQHALAEAELDGAGLRSEILLEPAQRNTAPAMALAAAHVAAADPSEVVAFLPADHYVPDEDRFAAALARAAHEAERANDLVVIGRRPDRPETGYGYIEIGEALGNETHTVARFTEKPDGDTAARFLAGGRHLWNTGIVVARARVLLGELQSHAPTVAAAVSDAVGAPNRYADAPNLSFDYAVLEKSAKVRVVEADFAWSDVGSWAGWAGQAASDGDGNAANAAARVLTRNAHGNAVWSEKTVVLNGVDDLVVLDTHDVLYVTHRELAGQTAEVRKHAIDLLPGLE